MTATVHSTLLDFVLTYQPNFNQRHPKETDQTYLARLHQAVEKAVDEDEGRWPELQNDDIGDDAQTWNNDASAALESKKPIPACDGMPEGEPAPKASKRTAAQEVAGRAEAKAKKQGAKKKSAAAADESESAQEAPPKKAAPQKKEAAPKKAAAKKAASTPTERKTAAARKTKAKANGVSGSRVNKSSPSYRLRKFVVEHPSADFQEVRAFLEKHNLVVNDSMIRTATYWIRNTIEVVKESGHWRD